MSMSVLVGCLALALSAVSTVEPTGGAVRVRRTYRYRYIQGRDSIGTVAVLCPTCTFLLTGEKRDSEMIRE
jgi:hypothetical protein